MSATISSLIPPSKSEQITKNVAEGEPLKICRPKGAYLPMVEAYQLELISPVSWNTLDMYVRFYNSSNST